MKTRSDLAELAHAIRGALTPLHLEAAVRRSISRNSEEQKLIRRVQETVRRIDGLLEEAELARGRVRR